MNSKILTVFIALGLASAAAMADADLPDEVRALLAKERARNFKTAEDKATKGVDQKQGGGKKDGPTIHRKGVVGGCDMEIGTSNNRPGTMNAKPQPVIITGPVVQVCKK